MIVTVRIADLPLGKPPAVRVDESLTVAVCQADNRYYAFNGRCPHRGAELAEGQVQGNLVICPLHHFKFNLPTGRCLMPKHLKLQGYPVVVEGDSLKIDLQVEQDVPRTV